MIVGTRISEAKAAALLGLSVDVLRRWGKFGVGLFRFHNNKRAYYLEDILNFQITRGLLPRVVLGTLSSSPARHNRQGGGPEGKQ